YLRRSFTFFFSTVAVPPLGVYVILGLTVTLPLPTSLRFCLPLARITSLTVPASTLFALAALTLPFTPLPETLRLPGLGTVARTVAVPFGLAFTFPRVKSLVGTTSAVALTRKSMSDWNGA